MPFTVKPKSIIPPRIYSNRREITSSFKFLSPIENICFKYISRTGLKKIKFCLTASLNVVEEGTHSYNPGRPLPFNTVFN